MARTKYTGPESTGGYYDKERKPPHAKYTYKDKKGQVQQGWVKFDKYGELVMAGRKEKNAESKSMKEFERRKREKEDGEDWKPEKKSAKKKSSVKSLAKK